MSEEKMKDCCGGHGAGHGQDWGKTVIVIVGLVLLASIIIVAILRDRIVNQQFKNVTVTGQGRVTYAPDLAIVNLGVQIDKVAKPEDALNQLNTKVTAIIAAVKKAGIKDDNIQTQNYSLYPQYDYKDNVSMVSGYNANEQLIIKVDGYDQNPDKLSRVIAAASQAGANQVNNLSYDSSQMNDLKQQARIMAIADAKQKSFDLARTAGVELKEVTSWYENFSSPTLGDNGVAADSKGGLGGGSSATPQTPSGNREVIVEIGLSYNIK